MTTLECAETQERAPEFALGVLHGSARAEVVAHLEHCHACSAAVADFAQVVDGLTLIVPEAEPPPGFEEHVLREMREQRRPGSNRKRTAMILGALIVVVASMSVGTLRVVDAFRTAPESARAADVRANDNVVGKAVVTGGSDAWVMLTIDGLADGQYRANVVDLNGDNVLVGEFSVQSGRGSWLVKTPVKNAVGFRVLNSDGTEVARAAFPLN
ncbi:MAG: zf-HC2 domain-containing protein [Acidimicrobiia bacterium]